MQLINTVRTSDPQSLSQKAGALIKKSKNIATAVVAAIGLTTSVEAGEAITITQMPNSTVSGPTFQPNSSGIVNPAFAGYQSSLRLQNRLAQGTLAQGTTRYILNLNASDVGAGGTLTVSWEGGVLTGDTIGNPNATGVAYASKPYYVQQLTNWSKEGGIPTVSTLATLNEHDTNNVLVPRNNNTSNALSTSEEIHLSQHFSVNVPITSAGTYNLDYVLQAMNTNGVATQNNLALSFVPIVNLDANANSIPDTWEIAHFGMLTPADGDPDHDGMSNLLEYALDTDPVKPTTIPITYALETGGDGQKYLTLSFTRNPLATNLNYTVQGSNDLQVWTDVQQVMSMTQTTVRDIVSIASTPQRFLRLKIVSK